MARDYYDILGIAKDASADAIKSAYRKLSKEWHPDKHKGDPSDPDVVRAGKKAEDKFKEINEAYEVLSNEQKRKAYDQFGAAGVNGSAGGFGGAGGFNGFDFSGFTGGQRVDFGDLFEGFFGGMGGGRRKQQQERGSDREVSLTIDFAQSVTGLKRTISIRKLVTCSECGGRGAKPGSSLINCTECGGTGQIIRTAQSFFGTVQHAVICTRCRGSGKVPEKPCLKCDGEGRIADTVEVTVDIPAGIADGQSLRLRGQGDVGRQGTAAGDLYVHIAVKSDPRFIREGDDIRSEASISIPDAVLGAEVPVQTVHGSVQLKVPVGTQSGQVFRIKHKGMPVLGTSRFGDHYVTVSVEIPSKLSREERKLVEEWKRLQK